MDRKHTIDKELDLEIHNQPFNEEADIESQLINHHNKLLLIIDPEQPKLPAEDLDTYDMENRPQKIRMPENRPQKIRMPENRRQKIRMPDLLIPQHQTNLKTVQDLDEN